MKGRKVKKKLVKVSRSMAALLNPTEDAAVSKAAKKAGVLASIWAADAVRARLKLERDERRNGIAGEPQSRPQTRHETNAPSLNGPVAPDQPALLIIDIPLGTTSWAQLEPETRQALAKTWAPVKPVPQDFRAWEPARKTRWLDSNWPLPGTANERSKAQEPTPEVTAEW